LSIQIVEACSGLQSRRTCHTSHRDVTLVTYFRLQLLYQNRHH
jgi:hypothetical protein